MIYVLSHVRHLIACTFIVASGLIVSGSVRAAAIYSQVTPGQPIGAFGSQDTPGFQKVADNFAIEGVGTTTVRSLRFLGGYADRTPPPFTPPLDALPMDDFRIVFLEDAGDRPGSIVPGANIHVSSPYRRTPINGPLLNGVYAPIEFVVNLSDGVVLNRATNYWLSISNIPGSDHGWLWARADGLLDSETAGTRDDIATGPWDSFSNGGMFFELYDNSVPEPSALTTLLLGVVIVLIRSKRR